MSFFFIIVDLNIDLYNWRQILTEKIVPHNN